MRFTQKRTDLPPLQPQPWRVIDARLHLLDRQLVDASGDPAGTLDDIEFAGISAGTAIDRTAPPPTVSAIMTGHALTTRILGGQPPPKLLDTVAWDLVADVGIVVSLTEDAVLTQARWREQWLCEHVISRIPGGRHAAQ